MEKLGGRKAAVALLVVAVGVAIELLTARGLSTNMLQLLSIVFGAFVVGNGVEHAAGALRKTPPTSQSSAEATKAVAALLASQQQTINALAQNAVDVSKGVNYLVEAVKKSEQA